MFGRKAKPATDPTHEVAAFVVRTLLGTVDTGLSSGLAFTKAYAGHQNLTQPGARAVLIAEVASMLAAEDPMMAGQLVDALAAKVGR